MKGDGVERPAKIRILIADDHPLVLEGLSSCLETYPHIEVVAAVTDGHAALEAAKRFQPDIVILDINMPRLNGLDVLAALLVEVAQGVQGLVRPRATPA